MQASVPSPEWAGETSPRVPGLEPRRDGGSCSCIPAEMAGWAVDARSRLWLRSAIRPRQPRGAAALRRGWLATPRRGGGTFWHDLAEECRLREEVVATIDRLGERRCPQGPTDSPLPVVEVDREMDPPRAVVVPEMMRRVVVLDPNRRIRDRHDALLSREERKVLSSSSQPQLAALFVSSLKNSRKLRWEPLPTHILRTCCQVR